MHGTGAYRSYKAAKARCENPNHVAYRYYGGRGIRFHFANFQEFYREVGDRPANGTIERIENSRGYERGNVRWATRQAQGNNKRNNRLVTAFGCSRTVAQWARETGIRAKVLYERLYSGWPPDRAVTKPPRIPPPPLRPPSPCRHGKPLFAFGRRLTVAAWSREKAIPAMLLYGRLQRGWSIERALTSRRWSRP